MHITTETTTHLTVKETAAAMRKALREAFPGVKVSVRMATGSAHGWMSVTWTDGPTPEQVQAILAPMQSARFDGMDDAYHELPQDGPMVYSCRGVTTQRRMSETAAEQIAAAINAQETGTPAAARGNRVEGTWIGEHAANRLGVTGYGCTEDGAVVDVDLAAHQIFGRTSYTEE
ncbi:LPD29 domain-containing protein [Janibacter corallicola]|uniref:LPD29 domain-containing protein n=1 Tax=Janibacter corallicola TaxID=415212 RepID=UPI000835E2FA|nr:LPD29 domain-containing protein [Janibacter corallicola]